MHSPLLYSQSTPRQRSLDCHASASVIRNGAPPGKKYDWLGIRIRQPASAKEESQEEVAELFAASSISLVSVSFVL